MTGTNATGKPAPRQRRALNPIVKLLLELGPLALFFVANSKPALFHGLVGRVASRPTFRLTKREC